MRIFRDDHLQLLELPDSTPRAPLVSKKVSTKSAAFGSTRDYRKRFTSVVVESALGRQNCALRSWTQGKPEPCKRMPCDHHSYPTLNCVPRLQASLPFVGAMPHSCDFVGAAAPTAPTAPPLLIILRERAWPARLIPLVLPGEE